MNLHLVNNFLLLVIGKRRHRTDRLEHVLPALQKHLHWPDAAGVSIERNFLVVIRSVFFLVFAPAS